MDSLVAFHPNKESKAPYLKRIQSHRDRYDVSAILPFFCYTRINCMTDYHFTTPKALLPATDVQEKKAARRKLLEEVEQRRRVQYRRFSQKMRLQPDSDLL